MHHSIKPIKMYVSDKYLYNMDTTKKGFSKCKIIAVSFYAGCYPTFTILIDDQYIFSDIPAEALHTKEIENGYNNSLLYYKLNPSGINEKFSIDYLYDKNIYYYIPAIGRNVVCEYICSFDFYNDNELMHMLLSASGEILFAPNHKIIINSDKMNFPSYQKLRKTWNY